MSRRGADKRLYVPLDASYYHDSRIIAAGEAAEVLWVRALCLGVKASRRGILTRRHLLTMGLEHLDARIAALVTVGLWIPVTVGWHVEVDLSRRE